MRALWLVIVMALLPGCRTAAPLIGAEEVPARATLAGRVTGPSGSAPPVGRLVSAVDVTTGERYSTKTQALGSFSLLVPPGRYRLEIVLIPAERIAESPGVIELGSGEVVDDANVVLGGGGLAVEP